MEDDGIGRSGQFIGSNKRIKVPDRKTPERTEYRLIENRAFSWRMNRRNTPADTRLRRPAMAKGFQEICLIIIPAVLQRTAQSIM